MWLLLLYSRHHVVFLLCSDFSSNQLSGSLPAVWGNMGVHPLNYVISPKMEDKDLMTIKIAYTRSWWVPRGPGTWLSLALSCCA